MRAQMHRGQASIKHLLVASATTLFLVGCGLSDPTYVDYAEGGDATSGDLTECQKAALTAFETNIQPVIVATCSPAGSCHSTQPVASKSLSRNDASTSKSALLTYTGTDSTRLYNKIAQESGQTHGGGGLGSTLPKATIDLWMTKEAECR